MSEAEIRNYCGYEVTETGRTVTPCTNLEHVLLNDHRSSAGLRVTTYSSFKGNKHGTWPMLFATKGRKTVANFCPICGTKLHPHADVFNENRALATTTHPQETGDV